MQFLSYVTDFYEGHTNLSKDSEIFKNVFKTSYAHQCCIYLIKTQYYQYYLELLF